VFELTLNISQKISGKEWRLMLQKDGEVQMDRSSEKQISLTQSQGRKEHPACDET